MEWTDIRLTVAKADVPFSFFLYFFCFRFHIRLSIFFLSVPSLFLCFAIRLD